MNPSFAELDCLYDSERRSILPRCTSTRLTLFPNEPLEKILRGRSSRCTPLYSRDSMDIRDAERAVPHHPKDTRASATMHDNIPQSLRSSRKSTKPVAESRQRILDKLVSVYSETGNVEAHRRRFGDKVIQAMHKRQISHTERTRPSSVQLRVGQRLSSLPRHSILRPSTRLSEYFSPRLRSSRKRTSTSFSNGIERILDAPGAQATPCTRQLSWSDSGLLAISLTDQIYIWDSDTHEAHHVHALSPSHGMLTCISWPAGSSYLTFSDSLGTTSFLDIERGKVTAFDGRTSTKHFITSHGWNGNSLAVGTSDGFVSFLDQRCAKWTRTFKCTDSQNTVSALAFHPSTSSHLLAVATASRLQTENRTSGSELEGIELHTRTLSTNNVPVHERDKTVNLYDTRYLRKFVDSKSFVKSLRTGSSTNALLWHPKNPSSLITGSHNGVVCTWDTARGVPITRRATGRAICALTASSEYTELMTAHYGFPYKKDCFQQLHLWSLNSLFPIIPFGKFEEQAQPSHQITGVLDSARSKCGEHVCALTSDESLKFWKVFPSAE